MAPAPVVGAALLTAAAGAGAASSSCLDELDTEADTRSRELLARTTAGPDPGPASALLAGLVASAADNSGLDAAAHAAAQPLLAQIDAIRKPRDVIKAVAALHGAGAPVLFGFDGLRDPESGQPRATFYPGGLGLPDPAYYGAVTPELQGAVAAYRAQLPVLLRFAGLPESKVAEQAASAWALEQALAQAMGGTTSESVLVAQLAKAYPALTLTEFMQGQGAAPSVVRLQQPGFFRALNTMLANPSILQWQAYLRAQLAMSVAPAMASDPRLPWLQALGVAPVASLTSVDRPSVLSRLDAADLFSAAYAEGWLPRADEQRAEAIGKPVNPVSFGDLHFERRSYAGNLMALRRWNKDRALARLSSAIYPWPVSQSQPIIGYQAAENRLIVTAALLRPPAFDRSPPAAEYGSSGALPGQQLALAFADFTGDDGRALASHQAALVPQFDAYTVSGTVTVNGLRTQRQDSADLTGLELAWDTFNAQGAADPAAAKSCFSAWASIWARNDSPAATAQVQAQSVFAPAKWRVNGPISNLPAFAQANACKPGQPMARAAKGQILIWR